MPSSLSSFMGLMLHRSITSHQKDGRDKMIDVLAWIGMIHGLVLCYVDQCIGNGYRHDPLSHTNVYHTGFKRMNQIFFFILVTMMSSIV